jgi:hypothetical protein
MHCSCKRNIPGVVEPVIGGVGRLEAADPLHQKRPLGRTQFLTNHFVLSHDRRHLESNSRLREDPAVQGGASDEQNVGKDQHDARH